MIAYYIFSFHMIHWSFILGQGWRLSNHWCKACQNCRHPSFVIVYTRSSADALIVALLWKLPQMPLCSTSTNNANLDMLSCTEISFVMSFFNFEKFGVKPGFPFTQLNQATYSKLGEEKKSNFDMFYKNYCWARSHLLSNMHYQCVINYERKITVIPRY